MTISSETRTAGPFTGTGVILAAAPFTFKVFTAADVLVVRTDLAGVETTLALTTDYTVTLNSNQDTSPGGTITTTGVLTTGFKINATSNVGNLQSTLLTTNGGFFPTVINDALDKLTILVQQLLNKINRSIKIPLSDGTALNVQLPTAAVRATKGIRFDGSGNVGVTAGDPDAAVTAAAASAAAAAASAATAVAAAAASALLAPQTDATTARTWALADASTHTDFTNVGAVTVTVPPNAAVPIPIGTQLAARQGSATGQITVVPGAAVTLQSKYGRLKSENAQFSEIFFLKIATNTWQITGDLSA